MARNSDGGVIIHLTTCTDEEGMTHQQKQQQRRPRQRQPVMLQSRVKKTPLDGTLVPRIHILGRVIRLPVRDCWIIETTSSTDQ